LNVQLALAILQQEVEHEEGLQPEEDLGRALRPRARLQLHLGGRGNVELLVPVNRQS
jgi:hypothetical protein